MLPLENVSGKAEQEYLADGMTDELITRLASLNDVRVISRTSVMQFRATREPLSKIGSMLHVDAVVEGSVLRDGKRVRITTRLVKVDSDRQLWAHSYEGDVADAIGLQREIARSVSDEIRAKLTPENKERLDTAQHPVPPEAYDAYLQGLYYAAKLTPDDLQKAVRLFQSVDAERSDARCGLPRAGGVVLVGCRVVDDAAPAIPREGTGRCRKGAGNRSESGDGASCAGMGQVCA